MNWPCHRSPKKPSTEPTPYDIFGIGKSEVYSKDRFYELVKIYHPDRQNHHSPDDQIHAVPTIERTERYRLVVQAHTILSDPARRKAYDATGAGWGEKTHWTRKDGGGRPHTPYEHDSPFANATWEDWERWYARNATNAHAGQRAGHQAYEGTYLNPNAFASFVILLAVLSGVLQATHAGQYTGSIEEKAAAFTAKTTQFMSERKVENTEYSTGGFSGHGFTGNLTSSPNADHRIRHFLERRDPSKYGLKDEEEETYRKHFAGQQDALPHPKKTAKQRPIESLETDKAD
jgi:curved DNA-binding protein CbpA